MQELDWFQAVVPTWPWKWATTFDGGAEHAYVIKGRHLDAATYERAARIIHGAGMPRKFYRRLNIELHLPDLEVPYGREPLGSRPMQHGVKFWLMSHRTSVSKALNIAPVGAEYGRQDAPSTATADVSPWDLNALDYDDAFERAGLTAMGESLRRAVASGGAAAPVLDLGARAGAALDLGIASLEGGYTAVEPSRGLMHSLLFKHGRARAVHVQSADDYLSEHEAGNLGTVVALFGAASYLRPQRIRELASKSRRLVLMHHLEDPNADFFGPTRLPHWAAASREAARALPDARRERLGDYLLTVV
jgi:hypothetical protein